MDRECLGDSISIGLKNISDILARGKYLQSQFRTWQRTSFDDEADEVSQQTEQKTDLDESFNLFDSAPSTSCQGEIIFKYFPLSLYKNWPIEVYVVNFFPIFFYFNSI